jgi:hypothetical protein
MSHDMEPVVEHRFAVTLYNNLQIKEFIVDAKCKKLALRSRNKDFALTLGAYGTQGGESLR